jgi:hypothetical protein
MGCRLPSGGGTIMPGAMPWKNRWLGNPVLSFIGRLFFKCPAHDFHCGLRGFTKAAFEKMDLQTTGMEFASEMVIKATLKQLKITEVPVTLRPDGRSRPPHLKPWRDGWRHLRFMLLLFAALAVSRAGIFLSALGIILAAALSFNNIRSAACCSTSARSRWRAWRSWSVFSSSRSRFSPRCLPSRRGLLPDDPKAFARLQGFHARKRNRARLGLPCCWREGGLRPCS